jgi:hypothetical protein
MPLLSFSAITNFPFQPFTKILSADTNLMFTTVQTLLNTTKLDQTNIQAHGLTRYTSASALAAGTASYAVYNDSNGDLTEAAQLPTAQGGLGFSPTISAGTALQVLQVNAAGNALTLAAAPVGPGGNIFNYYNFS